MAFIETFSPDQAAPELQRIYARVAGPDGQVDQVLQAHGLRPHTLTGHMGLYKAVLHHRDNSLPEWYLEAVGVWVSRLNGCSYCDQHHTRGMENLLADDPQRFDALNLALRSEQLAGAFNAREQAGLVYAQKLTNTPANITAADIDELRAQCFSDAEILELNQVAAYFAYANRTVSGLGVTSEGETLGLAPRADAGGDSWRHS